jgi:hypothetical protein
MKNVGLNDTMIDLLLAVMPRLTLLDLEDNYFSAAKKGELQEAADQCPDLQLLL